MSPPAAVSYCLSGMTIECMEYGVRGLLFVHRFVISKSCCNRADAIGADMKLHELLLQCKMHNICRHI